jgi:hypothetical protein
MKKIIYIQFPTRLQKGWLIWINNKTKLAKIAFNSIYNGETRLCVPISNINL